MPELQIIVHGEEGITHLLVNGKDIYRIEYLFFGKTAKNIPLLVLSGDMSADDIHDLKSIRSAQVHIIPKEQLEQK